MRYQIYEAKSVKYDAQQRVWIIFCSRLTKTHPSVRVKKNIKNMKQSQMNFKEIRLVLLLFLSLSPKHASQFQALPSSFFNLENNRESKKKTWFIRLRWEGWVGRKAEWMFRCGEAACPEKRKPSVRIGGNRLIYCYVRRSRMYAIVPERDLVHKPLSWRYPFLDQDS